MEVVEETWAFIVLNMRNTRTIPRMGWVETAISSETMEAFAARESLTSDKALVILLPCVLRVFQPIGRSLGPSDIYPMGVAEIPTY